MCAESELLTPLDVPSCSRTLGPILTRDIGYLKLAEKKIEELEVSLEREKDNRDLLLRIYLGYLKGEKPKKIKESLRKILDGEKDNILAITLQIEIHESMGYGNKAKKGKAELCEFASERMEEYVIELQKANVTLAYHLWKLGPKHLPQAIRTLLDNIPIMEDLLALSTRQDLNLDNYIKAHQIEDSPYTTNCLKPLLAYCSGDKLQVAQQRQLWLWCWELAEMFNVLLTEGNKELLGDCHRPWTRTDLLRNVKVLACAVQELVPREDKECRYLRGRAWMTLADACKKYAWFTAEEERKEPCSKDKGLCVTSCIHSAMEFGADDLFISERFCRHARQHVSDETDVKRVIDTLKTFVQKNPGRHVAWHQLGLVYLDLRNVSKPQVPGNALYASKRSQPKGNKSSRKSLPLQPRFGYFDAVKIFNDTCSRGSSLESNHSGSGYIIEPPSSDPDPTGKALLEEAKVCFEKACELQSETCNVRYLVDLARVQYMLGDSGEGDDACLDTFDSAASYLDRLGCEINQKDVQYFYEQRALCEWALMCDKHNMLVPWNPSKNFKERIVKKQIKQCVKPELVPELESVAEHLMNGVEAAQKAGVRSKILVLLTVLLGEMAGVAKRDEAAAEIKEKLGTIECWGENWRPAAEHFHKAVNLTVRDTSAARQSKWLRRKWKHAKALYKVPGDSSAWYHCLGELYAENEFHSFLEHTEKVQLVDMCVSFYFESTANHESANSSLVHPHVECLRQLFTFLTHGKAGRGVTRQPTNDLECILPLQQNGTSRSGDGQSGRSQVNDGQSEDPPVVLLSSIIFSSGSSCPGFEEIAKLLRENCGLRVLGEPPDIGCGHMIMTEIENWLKKARLVIVFSDCIEEPHFDHQLMRVVEILPSIEHLNVICVASTTLDRGRVISGVTPFTTCSASGVHTRTHGTVLQGCKEVIYADDISRKELLGSLFKAMI